MSENNTNEKAPKTVITFDCVADMKACTTLTEGTVCRTLGYHRAGDGGGASYVIEKGIDDENNGVVADDATVIATASTIKVKEPEGDSQNENADGTGDETGTGTETETETETETTTPTPLIARFTDEGRPVNVLQFGAINIYAKVENKKGTDPYTDKADRNDAIAIQKAIDYTVNKLMLYEKLTADSEIYSTYNINTIIVPGGNYTIKSQINMPPYIQFYLTGDVQFYSLVRDAHLGGVYELKKNDTEGNGSSYSFEEVKLPADKFKQMPSDTEFFAKNDFMAGEDKLYVYGSDKDEYYVYKQGVIKICHRFDENGKLINPYNVGDVKRYVISPSVNSEVFYGNGSLTILNKAYLVVNENDQEVYKSPYFGCGIEIGSTEDNIRYYSEKSTIKEKKLSYENLRFSNLKITQFHIGILQHGYSFYSSVFSDVEFFDNDIAFQFGVYGEKEDMGSGNIIGEVNINAGELSHFRDCLFTGNKISVNTMISGLSATFTSCHFDFENCLFRTAYRTCLMVDKCHIEGTGKELKKAYFPNGEVSEFTLSAFKDRAKKNPLDEFVGIIYARPIVKFDGSREEQRSYVDLSITSSRIIDTFTLPWSNFSYYNGAGATDCDGHFRSRLYLNNNRYAFANSSPVCFLTTKEDGIVQSGFLLSEYPERELAEGEVGTEKDAVQNVPVISRDSTEFGGFISASAARKNHRFLSNRTLENKYPYFQNVCVEDEKIEGLSINLDNAGGSEVILSKTGSYDSYNPFAAYVGNDANCLRIKDIYKSTNETDGGNDVAQPYVTFSLNNDMIDCKKGDVISAALVTDVIAFNSYHYYDMETYVKKEIQTPLKHRIHFIEICDGVEKKYSYETLTCINTEENHCFDFCYPSTSTCMHTVHNKKAQRVRVEIDFYVPIIFTDQVITTSSYTSLMAILVEKNK